MKIKTFLRKNKTKKTVGKVEGEEKKNNSNVGLKSVPYPNTSGSTTEHPSISHKQKQHNNNAINSPKNKSKKLGKKISLKKSGTGQNAEGINIPQVSMALNGNNIMNKDPFMKGNKGKNAENLKGDGDPRNGPFDGKRRSFNTIKQDDFSYTGEWRNGKRDGIGKLIWEKMAKFIGEFKEDRVIGYGKLFHEDGDVYRGYWNNFQAMGVGIYKNRKNIKYEGYWDKDKQNEFGIETWGKSNNYTGEYVQGFKNGIGIFKMEDKGLYQGEIQNGNIHGIGTFTFRKDKRTYSGEWKNNKMDGFGLIKWPDGRVFVGEFHEDKPEGFGIFYTNKKTYIGVWFSGLLEGEAIIVEAEKIKKQYWEEGRLTQNYSSDYAIFFEKYVDQIVKDKKFYVG